MPQLPEAIPPARITQQRPVLNDFADSQSIQEVLCARHCFPLPLDRKTSTSEGMPGLGASIAVSLFRSASVGHRHAYWQLATARLVAIAVAMGIIADIAL